jgi:hypothetical protein
MKPETCECVINALKNWLLRMGRMGFDKDALFEQCLRVGSASVLSSGCISETDRRSLRAVKNEADFRALLLRQPDPTPDEMAMLMAQLKLSPVALRKGLKQAVKQLPYDTGGHAAEITPEECKRIVNFIRWCEEEGISNAVQRASVRFAVSPRSIQRVWKTRNKPNFHLTAEAVLRSKIGQR